MFLKSVSSQLMKGGFSSASLAISVGKFVRLSVKGEQEVFKDFLKIFIVFQQRRKYASDVNFKERLQDGDVGRIERWRLPIFFILEMLCRVDHKDVTRPFSVKVPSGKNFWYGKVGDLIDCDVFHFFSAYSITRMADILINRII